MLLLAGVVGGVVLLTAAASVGSVLGPAASGLAALEWLVRGGWAPAAYLGGAIGLGCAFRPLLREAEDGAALSAGLGLAVMLWLSHLLGWTGLLGGSGGRVVAWLVVLAGLTMLGVVVSKWWKDRGGASGLGGWAVAAALAGVPAGAVLLAASVSPAGWLWESEFGGYDALSYHLQLPKEWLEGGRVRSLAHNVYSHLPSYVESAYAHLGAMRGETGARSLLAGDATWVLSCQLLHAGMGLLSAWLCARAAARVCERVGLYRPAARALGGMCGVIVLATAWVVVVGSLAYNELAVCALFAASLVAALEPGMGAWMKGLLCGVLVGGACGAKPTAILLAAPAVAIFLGGTTRPGGWLRLALAGSAAGLAMLAPWLARNWIETGNPVFPYATGWFGSAHWTGEQVSRFLEHHRFEGGLVDRLRLVVLADEGDPAGPRHRGVMHPQWFVLFPCALAGVVVAIARPASRRMGVLLGAGMGVQLLAWLLLTHVQSRFLLPVVVTGASAMAAGAAGACVGGGSEGRARRVPVAWALLLLVAGVQTVQTWRVYAGQRGGAPAALLAAGPGLFTGALGKDQEAWGPIAHANRTLEAGEVVYLVGEARALYLRVGHVYNTTWDSWPLGRAIEAHPDDPAAWNRVLSEMGITHALVSGAELARLERSGYADPRVSPEAVRAWIESSRVLRRWPGTGEVFLEVRGGVGR